MECVADLSFDVGEEAVCVVGVGLVLMELGEVLSGLTAGVPSPVS